MLSPFFVQAQLLDPVQFQVRSETVIDSVVSGERVTVSVQADIEDDWYLYSIANDPGAGPFPTSFSSVETYFRIEGDISESKYENKFDPNFDLKLGLHSNSANFDIPLRFNPKRSGLTPFTIEVLYQACDDVSCLPPVRKRVQGELFLSSLRETEINVSDYPPFDGSDAGFGVTPKSIENSMWGSSERRLVRDLKLPVVLVVVILLISLFYARNRRLRKS